MSATGGSPPRPLDAGHHPPEGVRQDRHTTLRPPLLQPAPEDIARLPPAVPCPTRGLHPLRALPPHRRPPAPPLRQLCQPGLLPPPAEPPSAWVTRALRLERTGAASGGRLRAARPARFARGTAARARRACRTLGGSGGPRRGDVRRAKAPARLVGRGDRPGDGRGKASGQTGLHLCPVGGAHRRPGLARAAPDVCGLPRQRTAAGTGARVVRHVVSEKALVLPVPCRRHVGADRGAAPLPALQRPARRLRQGARRRAAGRSRGVPIGVEALAWRERRPLRRAMCRDSPPRCPRLIVVLLAVTGLESARDALVKRREEVREPGRRDVARGGVDGFARAPVQSDACPCAAVERRAEPGQLPADLPEGRQGVLPKGRPRLVSRAPLL